jgi:hypothetical protein
MAFKAGYGGTYVPGSGQVIGMGAGFGIRVGGHFRYCR